MFARDALRRLVRHFADPAVGAVTGDVRLRSRDIPHGAGEGLFYRLQRLLQINEGGRWATNGGGGGAYPPRPRTHRPHPRRPPFRRLRIPPNGGRPRGGGVFYPAGGPPG